MGWEGKASSPGQPGTYSILPKVPKSRKELSETIVSAGAPDPEHGRLRVYAGKTGDVAVLRRDGVVHAPPARRHPGPVPRRGGVAGVVVFAGRGGQDGGEEGLFALGRGLEGWGEVEVVHDVSGGVGVVPGPVFGREPPDELGVRGAAAGAGKVGPAGRPRRVLGAAEPVGAHRVDEDERGDRIRVVRRVPHRHRPTRRPADEVVGTPGETDGLDERAQVVREVGHAPGRVERLRLGAAEPAKVGASPRWPGSAARVSSKKRPLEALPWTKRTGSPSPAPPSRRWVRSLVVSTVLEDTPSSRRSWAMAPPSGVWVIGSDPVGRHSTRTPPQVPRRAVRDRRRVRYDRFLGVPAGCVV